MVLVSKWGHIKFWIVEHAHDRKSSHVYFGKLTRVYVYAKEFLEQRQLKSDEKSIFHKIILSDQLQKFENSIFCVEVYFRFLS